MYLWKLAPRCDNYKIDLNESKTKWHAYNFKKFICGYVEKIALCVFGTSKECHQNIWSKFVEIQFSSSVIDRCQIRVNANRLNVMF